MEIVCTASYSVLINGEPRGYINPSWGIKQGDSLSPYLFLLCVEGLSSLIKQVVASHTLHGILSCNGGVCISHLLQLLRSYEEASDQVINRQETTIFFSCNTRPDVKRDIQRLMRARIMEDCEKYLGLPMVGGMSKVNTFRELREKISKRVMGWKEKIYFTSRKGNPNQNSGTSNSNLHYMGIFKIPKSLCDTINSILAKYWWGQTKDEKKIHWINWKKLCTPKQWVVWGLGIFKLLT